MIRLKGEKMQNFSNKAVEYFERGYSCSESVVRAAYDSNIIDNKIDLDTLNAISSPFSGGMGGTGCLCGALSGAQMALGLAAGRKSPDNDPHRIRNLSRELVEKFKEKRKATCCRVLSAPYKNNPEGRRQNCTELVREASETLETILKEILVKG